MTLRTRVVWSSSSKSVQSSATTISLRSAITNDTHRGASSSTSIPRLLSMRSTCLMACLALTPVAAAIPSPIAWMASVAPCSTPRRRSRATARASRGSPRRPGLRRTGGPRPDRDPVGESRGTSNQSSARTCPAPTTSKNEAKYEGMPQGSTTTTRCSRRTPCPRRTPRPSARLLAMRQPAHAIAAPLREPHPRSSLKRESPCR